MCLFDLLLYVPSQQLWSWRDGQLPNHTFFLVKLEQAVNQYLVHILLLVTDNNPSWMIQRKGGEWPKKLFHQSPRKYGTQPGSNSDHWICSQTRICCQTHYRLRYAARYQSNLNHWSVLSVKPAPLECVISQTCTTGVCYQSNQHHWSVLTVTPAPLECVISLTCTTGVC